MTVEAIGLLPLPGRFTAQPRVGNYLGDTSEDLDGGRILYRSFSATNFTSWYQNKNAIYWKTANFVLRRLRDLYVNGWEWIQQRNTYQENIHYNKPIYRAPTNRPMLRFLAAQGALFCQRKMRLLKRDQWFLGIHDVRHAGNHLKDSRLDTIYPPRDHFYADPFLFSRNGRSFIFFEDYSHRTNRGSISCLELHTKGDILKPVTVLERDYHLSYPFLIEWESEIYMIPETYDNRTVELYRAVDFPTKWVLHKVLLNNIRVVHPTLLRYGGRFWLFVNIAANEGSPANDELFLFHSASPLGPWVPHPQNPIDLDVRCARPAGRILEEDGMLVRPSQDCSTRYGHKINLNRIDVLSETEYREMKIGEITPDWMPGTVVTDTVSRDNNFVVLDGCRTVSRLGPGFSSAPRFLIGRSPIGVSPLQFQLGVAREATK